MTISTTRKRENTYELICNDLISLSHNVTAVSVQNKWKSLMRSYTKAKDNKVRTGQGPSRFHFFDQMNEILGNKPTNACQHSLGSLENSHQGSSSSLSNVSSLHEPESVHSDNTNEALSDVTPATKETPKVRLTERKVQQEYIQMKKAEYEKKQKRHNEKLVVESEKLEIEKKKIKLLEEYLQKK